MCSNSINKALKTLPFVQSVKPDIKNSSFEIILVPGIPASFDAIKQKVEGAGFSVAKLKATVNFNNIAVENDSHVMVNNVPYHFFTASRQTLNGLRELQVIDKGFVTAKEFRKNINLSKMECFKTGKAGTCCSKSDIKAGERIYHVII
jgi:copper chaperone CopZ